MNANSLSAWEAMQTKLPKSWQTIMEVFRRDPLRALDSYQLADRIGKSNGDTKPRLTEMYQMNWLKIANKDDVKTEGKLKRNLYKLRMPTDPDNVIEKSPIEILQDKLTAVMEGIGLTERDVNAYYRNWIEAQIKLSKDAEQFSKDIVKKMEAVDAENEMLKQGKCYDICKNNSTVKCFKCSPIGRENFERINYVK